MELETKSLTLVLQCLDEARKSIAQMSPQDRAQVSPAWLALFERATKADPWIHGFAIHLRAGKEPVGSCGFKGPQDEHGAVEIAYGIDSTHQGKGYATEAAEALANYAFTHPRVRIVRAHTLPQANASGRVLIKCGFERMGEVLDPYDGLVWRWEKRKNGMLL